MKTHTRRSGTHKRLILVSAAVMLAASGAAAQGQYPRAGWRAELSTNAHDVSGTVTIVDADTIRFDNFYFDGGGLSVRATLGAANTRDAFIAGRYIGPDLLGTVYQGESLTIDLPAGETLDGANALSVWCIPARANFGSGTFTAPPCVTDVDDGSGTGTPDGGVTIEDFLYYLAIFDSGNAAADVDDGSGQGVRDGGVTIEDLLYFLNRFAAGC